jgi:hypothetical protein
MIEETPIRDFRVQVILETPLLLGSLTALLDLLVTDVENGETIRLHYYKKRIKELSEEYPDLYFPKTK